MSVKYVVLNENTLGYIDDSAPLFIGVLAGSVLKGGPNPLNGPVTFTASDQLRPATIADFEAFRVDPKGHIDQTPESRTPPTQISDFTTTAAHRFAISDVTFDAVRGTEYFELASGKTKEDAIERFYSRFVQRDVDRDMMLEAQRNNRLYLHEVLDNQRKLLEAHLTLIAVVDNQTPTSSGTHLEGVVSRPRYRHDCTRCTFLGQNEEYDLYHCIQSNGLPTVLARYSDAGPDYSSGVESTRPVLMEAKRRALQAGLSLIPQKS